MPTADSSVGDDRGASRRAAAGPARAPHQPPELDAPSSVGTPYRVVSSTTFSPEAGMVVLSLPVMSPGCFDIASES